MKKARIATRLDGMELEELKTVAQRKV